MLELFQEVFELQTCSKVPLFISKTHFKVLTLHKKQEKVEPLGPLLSADPDIFLGQHQEH